MRTNEGDRETKENVSREGKNPLSLPLSPPATPPAPRRRRSAPRRLSRRRPPPPPPRSRSPVEQLFDLPGALDLLVDPHRRARPVPEPVEARVQEEVAAAEVVRRRGVVGVLRPVGAEVAPAVELFLYFFSVCGDGMGCRERGGEREGGGEKRRRGGVRGARPFSPSLSLARALDPTTEDSRDTTPSPQTSLSRLLTETQASAATGESLSP